MRPLEGVVIDRGAGLTIRLKSGALIRIARRNDLLLGDTCYVLYDYTQLEVYDVWTEDEYFMQEDDGSELNFELPPDYEKPSKWAVEPEGRPVVSL